MLLATVVTRDHVYFRKLTPVRLCMACLAQAAVSEDQKIMNTSERWPLSGFARLGCHRRQWEPEIMYISESWPLSGFARLGFQRQQWEPETMYIVCILHRQQWGLKIMYTSERWPLPGLAVTGDSGDQRQCIFHKVYSYHALLWLAATGNSPMEHLCPVTNCATSITAINTVL